MIQKITQNNGNFWTVNLIMRAKIVNQSSDFPVRRTGSYRHKKSTGANAAFAISHHPNITRDLTRHGSRGGATNVLWNKWDFNVAISVRSFSPRTSLPGIVVIKTVQNVYDDR